MRTFACLTEKAPLLEKYPLFVTSFALTDAAYFSNLVPELGQKVLPPTIPTIAGTRVRATERATRTPRPTTNPIVLRKTMDVRARDRKEMITVAPEVAILSPAQVTDFSTASWTDNPLTL